ncbi:MAG: dynamin family protein [Pseudomonadota bacterium]
MNIETDIKAYTGRPAMISAKPELVSKHLSALEPLAKSRDAIDAILRDLIKVGDRAMIERARKLQSRLSEMEPAITMIGQVKAGKTSLVNAMVGKPGLLPSDVNPWTSVVTSLHLNPRASAAQNSARFEFLGRMDWDRLVKGGGRIGELARRAGADSELARVTEQVAALREKSRKRLGDKFEMLLGQDHDYGYFDGDLIERYVCLGDDFEDDTDISRDRGRFADITKSAHINMAHDATPMRLCIRDTPGVNDTFLVREQITMKAIRGSQLCVVVLAAHQALSTVDLALMRLISNLKSRDVVIFVNRIDELSDPDNQVPEIRESILNTLKTHQGPETAEVIFGSAAWANHLLEDRLADLDRDSADALLNYTKGQVGSLPDGLSDDEIVWHLSGLGQLHEAMANRIAAGQAISRCNPSPAARTTFWAGSRSPKSGPTPALQPTPCPLIRRPHSQSSRRW